MTSLQAFKTEIESKLKGVTEGPWHTESEDVEGEFGDGPDPGSGYKSFFVENGWGKRICDSHNGEHLVEVEHPDQDDFGWAWDSIGKANLEFIAYARTALPQLLALAEELQAKLSVAETALESCRIMVEHEIRSCELMGRSANAWPDLLTGCVSGGGITAALAEIRREESK